MLLSLSNACTLSLESVQALAGSYPPHQAEQLQLFVSDTYEEP